MAAERGSPPRGRSDGDHAGESGLPTGGAFVATRVDVEGREETRIVELPVREPEPWREGAALSVVGRAIPRVDAVEKVTGRARYTADTSLPGMLHAAILRAPVARGRLTSIDLDGALAIPGVRDAIALADVPEIETRGVRLFETEIHYAGQPVAAVCADDMAVARRALQAVVARYDRAPHAVGIAAALAPGAPLVRGTPRSGEEPRVATRGDVERGLREADVVVRREYRTPVAIHTALEPHSAVAEWSAGSLTVWESTQGIFAVRDELADAFGLPKSRVRVICEYMGGGFGAKNEAAPHTYVAAILARRTGRPVRCVLDREAEQTDTGNRPSTVQRVTLGARRDGTLTAIALEAEVALGVGGWEGGPGKFYHQMYSCPNVRTEERFLYIDAPAMSSFRAPGHVEGAFGLERAMDVLARELGVDPLDLRVRNHAVHDEERDRPYTSKRLRECYARGAEHFGWSTRESRRAVGTQRGAAAPAVAGDSGIRRGFGMASQVWGAGGGPPAYALVKIQSDGSIDVLTGTQDLGTGSRTILAQIAAEALGARVEDVRVLLGDTERGLYAGNSWGSMTTPSVGPAVRLAAEEAREKLLQAAGGMLGGTPDELDVSDGIIRMRDGGASCPIAEVARKLGNVMITGTGNRGPNPENRAIQAFGAQFAEVEVDVGTGIVRVLRIVAAHDAGRVVNPALARSQLEGGIIQGVGYALFEERVMDERLGVQLNPNMHDYKIPTMADLPTIEAFFVEGADAEANHTGAKGLAEPPIIPTAPAIANAVADALGVEVDRLPLSPWCVLRNIDEAGTA